MSKQNLWQRSKQRIRFRNKDMDFYFAWILAHQQAGGAALGECFHAAGYIQDGNPKSWYTAWIEIARRVESQATVAQEKGHSISAREAYLRAFTYYQFAAVFVGPREQRLQEVWQKAQWCFQQAVARLDPPIEPVQIPFEGKSLPGYFLHSYGGTKKAPTLIMIGGGETCAEELYFWVGPAGVCRGYHVLLVDLPGQGRTPFAGLFFRIDSEAPIKVVVDYVLTRPEVDPDRLGLFGISGGGYMVSRAISFEKRVKACIASAPIVDMYRLIKAEIPRAFLGAPTVLRNLFVKWIAFLNPLPVIAMEKLCWQAGVSSISQALDMAQQAKVEKIDEITCPVLCLCGEAESDEQKAQAREFYDSLKGVKEFRIFTAADGADAHCQVNNLSLIQQVVFDWLDDVFGYNKEG